MKIGKNTSFVFKVVLGATISAYWMQWAQRNGFLPGLKGNNDHAS